MERSGGAELETRNNQAEGGIKCKTRNPMVLKVILFVVYDNITGMSMLTLEWTSMKRKCVNQSLGNKVHKEK